MFYCSRFFVFETYSQLTQILAKTMDLVLFFLAVVGANQQYAIRNRGGNGSFVGDDDVPVVRSSSQRVFDMAGKIHVRLLPSHGRG